MKDGRSWWKPVWLAMISLMNRGITVSIIIVLLDMGLDNQGAGLASCNISKVSV